ncbi:GNAT family N-acetyltransferase [Streptomyces sp. NPDC057460]|uniref:GNAT family N-acetyltransferase n=1 Tax=Streptomyces sp. NPDC057460 TaxID=3346141 RepID=UPI0036CD40C7
MVGVTTRWRGKAMSGEEQVPVTEQLIDSIDQGRFELCRDDDLVGWLYYTHLKPNRYALRHTEVETSHQHQGVAGALVRRVLGEIRARGGHDHRNLPLCGRLPLANDRLCRSGRRPTPGLLRSCCCRVGASGGSWLRLPGRNQESPRRSPIAASRRAASSSWVEYSDPAAGQGDSAWLANADELTSPRSPVASRHG